MIILAVAIIPAMESIRSGLNATVVYEEIVVERYRLLSKMHELQSLPFDDLIAAADSAGSYTALSEYSDALNELPRRLVHLSFYDVDDSDSDGDAFTILDSNLDSDNNPYTVLDSEPLLSLLWVSVELENSNASLQTLIMR